MAMGQCPECGDPVSTQSKACPHCGCDFKQYARSLPMHPHDKKVWAIIIVCGVLYLIILGPSNARRAREKEEADTRAWQQEQDRKQFQEEQDERVRDAWRAFNR